MSGERRCCARWLHWDYDPDPQYPCMMLWSEGPYIGIEPVVSFNFALTWGKSASICLGLTFWMLLFWIEFGSMWKRAVRFEMEWV